MPDQTISTPETRAQELDALQARVTALEEAVKAAVKWFEHKPSAGSSMATLQQLRDSLKTQHALAHKETGG